MPAAGSGALTAEVVIPIGKAPIATVALPIAFTSDGVTVKEKLLEGNAGGRTVELPGGGRVKRHKNRLEFESENN